MTHLIGKTEYELFSIEKASEGGRFTQKELKGILKELGIKFNLRNAYSPYVGQYGIYIEKTFEDVVENLLWSDAGLRVYYHKDDWSAEKKMEVLHEDHTG